MAAYLEFQVKGGGCAIVEAGMIGAVVGSGHDVWKVGSAQSPTLIVLRAGETLEVVSSSPAAVIARVVQAREIAKKMKYEGIEVYVDWLEPMGADDAAGPG